ncbi:hypothetical protein KI614_03305 [Dechloromonas denitrificans]|uniref:DUF6776 family protein n=1 Tax=Dechloromonas denitrificans TaxID=281362 RepID=UPI001CF81A21|nr:DUF6776 family protein [Dechloromonas denitrificans]UCV12278.1 hypothetical protein KI614_03305 [Dechloromonas denitrificans]
MPSPAVSLRLRKFRRRFGIAAPRLVVRQHIAWPWVVFPLGALVLCSLGGFLWVLQNNQAGVLERELAALRIQVLHQADELMVLRATAGTEKNAVHIERTAQQGLLARLKGVEDENSLLREDVRLFERLLLSSDEEAAVRIEGFRVVPDGAGRYRYRLILFFRPAKQVSEFRGRLQFLVTFEREGKIQRLSLSEKKELAPTSLVEFKTMLRREGVVEIPEGAVLRGVEVRVLQGDTLRANKIAQY